MWQVDAVTRKADEQKREADLRLTEFAQLLDIRAQRIKVVLLLFCCVAVCFTAAVIMSANNSLIFLILSTAYWNCGASKKGMASFLPGVGHWMKKGCCSLATGLSISLLL